MKERRPMNKRTISILFILLTCLSLAQAQDIKTDNPRFLLQEKRPDVKDGSSVFVLVFVSDLGEKLRSLDIDNPRITLVTGFEVYNQLVADMSYDYSKLLSIGVKFPPSIIEKVENVKRKAQEQGEIRRKNNEEKNQLAASNLDKATAEMVSFVKSIAHPEESKQKISYEELKQLELQFNPFQQAIQDALDWEVIKRDDAEAVNSYLGMIDQLGTALGEYMSRKKPFLKDDKQGSLKLAIEKIAGCKIAGIEKKNNMWKRAFRKETEGTWVLLGIFIGGCFIFGGVMMSGMRINQPISEFLKRILIAIGALLAWLLILFLLTAFL